MRLGILVNTNKTSKRSSTLPMPHWAKGHEVILFTMDEGRVCSNSRFSPASAASRGLP